jgi:putative ABC transport system permease protein
MFFIVFKKMLKNKWMILCLLAGFIIAIAMISSIPMYTSGIMQRMLTKDLENFQAEQSDTFPGRYLIKQSISMQYSKDYVTDAYIATNNRVTKDFIDGIGLPIIKSSQVLTVNYLEAVRMTADADPNDTKEKIFVTLDAISGVEDNVKILYGELPSDKETDGVTEVMITEETMKRLDIVVGSEYDLIYDAEEGKTIKAKITGVFTIDDPANVFWFNGLSPFVDSMVMNFDLFNKTFIDTKSNLITSAQWFYALDYHKITIENIDRIVAAYRSQEIWALQNRSITIKFPAIKILEQYKDRKDTLVTSLWVLQVPVLIMLLFYMYIVSKLSIDFEKNEISVMQSRGAGRLRIFGNYLMESLILSAIALVPGIILGFYLCKFLGASNGFLEFIQRTALTIKINPDSVIYAAAIAFISVLAMVIPAFIASKSNILEFKRKKTKFAEQPFWKKFFLDIILLGVSAYGLYTYNLRKETLEVTGIESTAIKIDPMLFLISTFFVIGAGLLFLRIYPYIVKLVFRIGRRIWSPPLYAGFLQVARSHGQEQFLMLFLVLSISIGILNANTARTLNSNTEDEVRYKSGADITLTTYWESNLPPANPLDAVVQGSDTNTSVPEHTRYIEPPFTQFKELDGVEYATKVLRLSGLPVSTPGGKNANEVDLMGIISNEFSNVAWFRHDLLPVSWRYYLNMLTKEPSAMLLSSTFRDNKGVKLGDVIKIRMSGSLGYVEGIVYGFIDYWPTFNPNVQTAGDEPGYLIVANLGYIYSRIDLIPYEVWLKKSEGATSDQIYADIKAKKIRLATLNDSAIQLVSDKNDPMLQGTNGSLTLGFVVAMGISILGFLIYWILSIKKRALQFGIFRAIGMSKKDILTILILEQILISGTAILIGVIIGGISSNLFIPLLNLTQKASEQVPPFKVIAEAGDYLKVYGFAGAMLAIGMVVLGVITSRIKISQVIKLGED